MARLDPFEVPVWQPDAPQSIVLGVVDDLHRRDHEETEDDVDQESPWATHPVHQRIPRGGQDQVAPERIREVPDWLMTASQAVALEAPGLDEAEHQVPGEVLPEAHALGRGSGVPRSADLRVMNIDMLGGVLGVGNGGQQEVRDPAFPRGAPVG